jgi:hypothetical protein
MVSEIFAKIYVIEIKRVISFCPDQGEKTRGEKMKDSLAMLLKTHVEIMSIYGLLAMLMKISKLQRVSGDLDENTCS